MLPPQKAERLRVTCKCGNAPDARSFPRQVHQRSDCHLGRQVSSSRSEFPRWETELKRTRCDLDSKIFSRQSITACTTRLLLPGPGHAERVPPMANSIAYCSGVGCRHPGARAFLVSTSLLRQYGLLPRRLRSVGGDSIRLCMKTWQMMLRWRK